MVFRVTFSWMKWPVPYGWMTKGNMALITPVHVKKSWLIYGNHCYHCKQTRHVILIFLLIQIESCLLYKFQPHFFTSLSWRAVFANGVGSFNVISPGITFKRNYLWFKRIKFLISYNIISAQFSRYSGRSLVLCHGFWSVRVKVIYLQMG